MKNNITNVLVLSPYPTEGASFRFRVHQFLNDMRENDIEFVYDFMMDSEIFKLKSNQKSLQIKHFFQLVVNLIKRIFRVIFGKHDVVLLHREFSPAFRGFFHYVFVLINKKPLIFDFDDAIFLRFPIMHLLRKSSHVLAGNTYLAEYAAQYLSSLRITVLPTVVDIDSYKITKPKTDQLTLGWIGSHSTFIEYLLPFLDKIIKFCEEKSIKIIIICSSSVLEYINSYDVIEFCEWTLESESLALNRFDIGIMPLNNNPFSLGKCGFKLIEYGAVGIPSVASKIGANISVIKDHITGFLAENDKEWIESLALLVDNNELRELMGRNARAFIDEEFSVKSKISILKEVIKNAHNEGIK